MLCDNMSLFRGFFLKLDFLLVLYRHDVPFTVLVRNLWFLPACSFFLTYCIPGGN